MRGHPTTVQLSESFSEHIAHHFEMAQEQMFLSFLFLSLLFLLQSLDPDMKSSELTIDIVNPSAMSLDGIRRESDQLHATLGELGLILGQSRQLCGAHGSVVFRMREQYGPFVANPFMEVDEAQGRLSLEIWGGRSQAESRRGQAASVSGASSSLGGVVG
jgi:hypothetical protein